VAQKRFTDRGRPYDHEAWRSLYRNTLSPGVYSGYTVTPSSVSASQVDISPGAVLLPTGIVVVEDAVVTVQIDGVFPPSAPTNYTIKTHHSELAMGLIGGEAMTYAVEAALLAAQPSDGVILGWIRHPGGGVPLETSHITNAPKYAPAEVASDFSARMPVVEIAPNLVSELGLGVSHDTGFDLNHVWRGFSNPSTAVDTGTGLTPIATSWFQYPLYERPWEIKIQSILPVGDQIVVSVFDSLGVEVATSTLTTHTAWQQDTISVPTATGTFNTGTKATVKLVSTVAQGTIVKLADIVVDFWPYAFPQF
jgi:hypothetical protein